MTVGAATISAMPGELERLPGSGPGPAAAVAVAVELTSRIRAELPAIGELEEREQVLVAAWLTGLRSARTRRAYAGDMAAWLGWLADRDTDVLAAGRVHVDLWAATVAGVSGTLALRAPLRVTRRTRWPESSPRSAMSAAQASSTRRAL